MFEFPALLKDSTLQEMLSFFISRAFWQDEATICVTTLLRALVARAQASNGLIYLPSESWSCWYN